LQGSPSGTGGTVAARLPTCPTGGGAWVHAPPQTGRKFSASSPFPFLHRRWQPLSPAKGTKRNNKLF